MEPFLFEKIFSFLDYKSVCRLEETCRLLREVVIQTKVYKKKFGLVCEARPADAPMDQELVQEMSCFYKNKLFEHFHRWVHISV